MSSRSVLSCSLHTLIRQPARKPRAAIHKNAWPDSFTKSPSPARQHRAPVHGAAQGQGQTRLGGSRLYKAAALGAYGMVFATAGFLVALYSTVPAGILGLRFLSDADSRDAYIPEDEEARQIEAQIDQHPLVVLLRQTPGMGESRPHLKLPEAFRKRSLTAGALQGSRKLSVPPFTWRDGEGKSLVSVCYIGGDLCGHPGIVHGGLLATLLDEGLAGCCFEALPHKIGVTAKLEVNYRSPARAGGLYVLRANTTKVEGRKAWVEGRIETLESNGKEPTVIVEATALFVSPRNARMMPKIHTA